MIYGSPSGQQAGQSYIYQEYFKLEPGEKYFSLTITMQANTFYNSKHFLVFGLKGQTGPLMTVDYSIVLDFRHV